MRKSRDTLSPLPEVPLTALLSQSASFRPDNKVIALPMELLWGATPDDRRRPSASAKRQCEAWGLPWAARLVPKEACTPDMLEVARFLTGSTFSQTLPHRCSPAAMRLWARLVTKAGRRNAAWVAHNALRLIQLSDTITAMKAADFANHAPAFPTSKKAEVVLQESAAWHEEQREWRAERADELRRRVAAREDGLAAPPSQVRYPWARKPIRHGDYELRLLTSRSDIDDEAYAMRHCVWRYWPAVQFGGSIIGSIRHHGLRKATVEFDHEGELVQVHGRGNRTVSAEIAGVAEEFSEEIVRRIR